MGPVWVVGWRVGGPAGEGGGRCDRAAAAVQELVVAGVVGGPVATVFASPHAADLRGRDHRYWLPPDSLLGVRASVVTGACSSPRWKG